MSESTTASKIVARIEKDLCNRKGLGDEWDRIDPEIQQEIRETWRRLIRDELRTPAEET
jgi:hypothetical protein